MEGLLSLMLLNESRRAARVSESHDVILLGDQDRSLWSRPLIDEGQALVEKGCARGLRPYTVQARCAVIRCRDGSRDGLGADHRAVRLAAALRADADRRAEPRRGGSDARRTRSGPRADRRDPGAWSASRLSPRALGARGHVPALVTDRRSARVVPPSARAHAASAGAPLPRTPPARARRRARFSLVTVSRVHRTDLSEQIRRDGSSEFWSGSALDSQELTIPWIARSVPPSRVRSGWLARPPNSSAQSPQRTSTRRRLR